MKYLVILTPLEPFLFGGDTTFGMHANKEEGSYMVKSTQYPQQTALLGMLRREFMVQAGYLTRKRQGEWVDTVRKKEAEELVGRERFDIEKKEKQDFKTIQNMSPVFLFQNAKRYIKKVAIENYIYENGLLNKKFPKNENDKYYTEKDNMYDNYVCLDGNKTLSAQKIWESVDHIGNKKAGGDNSLFKKTSYVLKDGFKFAFYLECKDELKNSMVMLGADRSAFKMEISESDDSLKYESRDYITLLSDAYVPEKLDCVFAITSEISFRNLQSLKHFKQKNTFKKSQRVFLYEKGSVFFEPTEALLKSLNNENLQQIGYNIFTGEA